MTEAHALQPTVISAFKDIVGAEFVITDPVELRYYSEDVYRSFETALAVIQPENARQLGEIVSLCKKGGLRIVARGGGMSYTDSYLHATRRGVSIDMRRMNRIIDINTEDMIVTVECGCTWQKLNEALAPHGLRPPYWGPLSGVRATVGGALSQNSVFWGGTSYGTAAESVIGLDVLLGNGEILPTGAHGKKDGVPFMRYDGPDLTGLFIGDSGALGIKTVATLRLVTIPDVVKYASFSFETHQQICAAMSETGRRGLASECYGFDPFLQNSRVLGGDADVRNIFLRRGAVHFQIGKYYPYKDSRRDSAWDMLERIKDLLDKDGVINPGQLGLDRGHE